MPRGVLRFTLPQERDEFELAQAAGHLDLVIHNLDQYLRGKLKYDDSLTEEQTRIYQEVRDKLWELKNDT